MKYDLSILIPVSVIPAFTRFVLLVKPISPLLAKHSFLMSNRIARFAASPLFTSIKRKAVSVFALSLPCILRRYANSSNYVFLMRHQLKMSWITAGSISTNVVKMIQLASGNRLYKERIYYSVYAFSPSAVKALSVSSPVLSSNPVPTPVFRVYRNLLKKSSVFFGGKINFKQFHTVILSPL